MNCVPFILMIALLADDLFAKYRIVIIVDYVMHMSRFILNNEEGVNYER